VTRNANAIASNITDSVSQQDRATREIATKVNTVSSQSKNIRDTIGQITREIDCAMEKIS